jgi:hypothetical protein
MTMSKTSLPLHNLRDPLVPLHWVVADFQRRPSRGDHGFFLHSVMAESTPLASCALQGNTFGGEVRTATTIKAAGWRDRARGCIGAITIPRSSTPVCLSTSSTYYSELRAKRVHWRRRMILRAEDRALAPINQAVQFRALLCLHLERSPISLPPPPTRAPRPCRISICRARSGLLQARLCFLSPTHPIILSAAGGPKYGR